MRAVLAPTDIAQRRLANQRLVGPPLATPLDVVRALGAVQSQDEPGGKWGIALRTPGAPEHEVERALTDGTIVRTHVLRPTWHYVAAEDIRWMLALTAPQVRKRMAPYDRHLELDETLFARCNRLIEKALAGGTHLTRTALRDVLNRAGIETNTQRLAHLVMRAELDALVCSGVRQGRQTTYALLEERVAPVRAPSREEALAELAARYFATRGPATAQDFSWWSGLTAADAREGAAFLGAEFARATVDRKTYWYPDRPSPAPTQGAAHLLPNYDEYFVGLKDRGAIGELVKDRGEIPGDTFFAHLLMLDGQLAGGWQRTLGAKCARVALRLAVRPTTAQRRAIEAQAERYAAFLGVPVTVEGWTPVAGAVAPRSRVGSPRAR